MELKFNCNAKHLEIHAVHFPSFAFFLIHWKIPSFWVCKNIHWAPSHAKCFGSMEKKLKLFTLSLRNGSLNWSWKPEKVDTNAYETAKRRKMNTSALEGEGQAPTIEVIVNLWETWLGFLLQALWNNLAVIQLHCLALREQALQPTLVYQEFVMKSGVFATIVGVLDSRFSLHLGQLLVWLRLLRFARKNSHTGGS